MDTNQKNPFQPIYKKKLPFPLSIFPFFFALMKLPLFTLVFAFSLLYSLMGSVFPIKLIGRMIIRGTCFVLFKVMILLLGMLSINPQPTALVDTYSPVQEVDEPKPGDVIIANCASYLNLFWLQFKFSPLFVIPCNPTNVYVFDFYGLFFKILNSQPLVKSKSAPFEKVLKLARKRSLQVVIFPEGAVTNGEYIINFQEFGRDIDLASIENIPIYPHKQKQSEINTEKIHFYIYGFIHFGSNVSPNFTYGNGFLHFFRMLGRPFSGMKIKMALPQDIPKIEKNTITVSWIERCRTILSTILGVEKANVDRSEFQNYTSLQTNKSKKHHD